MESFWFIVVQLLSLLVGYFAGLGDACIRRDRYDD